MLDQNTDIKGLWEEAQRYIHTLVRDYHLNHAFCEGYQWVRWSPVELTTVSFPDDLDRISVTMNHLRSNMRTIIADLTQRPLTFESLPSAYDDGTIRASKIVEGLLRDISEEHTWEVLREGLMKAVLKGGTALLSVDWSEANQTTVENVVGLPEFVVEPGARDAERARWWVRQQLLPPREVQAMFSDHFPDAPPEADGRIGMSSDYSYDNRTTPLTRVFTYYERPNPLCPEGAVVVQVAGKRLQELKWPFPFTQHLNIAVVRESLVESEAYGSTVLSDVRSPQTALNAAWSGFLEHIRESSTHRLVFDDSWMEAIDGLNDRAGAPLIGPKAKGAPEYLRAPQAPPALLEGIQLLKAEIDNLMGVHDVSRGKAPANIESGYGIQILTENDGSPVTRLIREQARAWSKIGAMVAQIHETEVRTTRETSIQDGAAPAVRKWKGSDIKGQTRVRVPTDAIMPRSRAAQQQWAQEALKMGLIKPDDPLAVMRFAKLADMPDQRGVVAAVLPDVDKAIRENEAVVLEEIPIPNDFDNHLIHVEVHNDFRKSLEYSLMSDTQRSDIDNHVKAHQMMAQEAIASQRMASDVDPALAAAPRADGAPPIEPLPAAPPPPPLPEEELPLPDLPDEIPPDQAADDMLAAIAAL